MAKFFSLLHITMALAYRDIVSRYRRSLLGPLWAIMQPLLLMAVFTLLRTVVDIPSDGVPYIIFSYVGLVPWTFFTSAVNRAGSSILANSTLIKKSPVAREIFPLAALMTALFDFCMSGIILAGMLVYFHMPLGTALVWMPVLVLLTAVLAFGVGMLVAALGCFRQDVIFAASFGLQLWLYASPVIYPLSAVPRQWQFAYRLNPMAGIIDGFRNVLIKNTPPDGVLLILSCAITIGFLALSWPIFRRCAHYFADVL
ncbi:MAG: ABC transporter permease [Desulfobacterota bacterium]|nr:ABC transporter permease [Thermodesulfobacteriota bacterium]